MDTRPFLRFFEWAWVRGYSQSYIHITISSCSLASHTLRREEGSCHAATIELSSRQKLDVTNQIRALRRSHLLSWSTIMSRVQRISVFYYLTAVFDNCIPWRQLGSCSVTRPVLSLHRVWLARLLKMIPCLGRWLPLMCIFWLDLLD